MGHGPACQPCPIDTCQAGTQANRARYTGPLPVFAARGAFVDPLINLSDGSGATSMLVNGNGTVLRLLYCGVGLKGPRDGPVPGAQGSGAGPGGGFWGGVPPCETEAGGTRSSAPGNCSAKSLAGNVVDI